MCLNADTYAQMYVHLLLHLLRLRTDAYVRLSMHTFALIYFGAYVRLCLGKITLTCICTYVHFHLHTFVHMQFCTFALLHSYTFAQIRLLRLRTFAHTYLCEYVHLRLRTFPHTYIFHESIYAHVHLSCVHLCLRTIAIHTSALMHICIRIFAYSYPPCVPRYVLGY